MEFIFATNNAGKVREIKQLSGNDFSFTTLKENGIVEDIPEPFDSFEENAFAKAHYVFQKTGKNCFAEDSGLIVPALDGAPGVHSARYAGEHDDQKNNEKLLLELQSKTNRTAWYQATICLILEGNAHYFTGKCMGKIIEEYRGDGGFGYDPLFMPDGYNQTFGELNPEIKNSISHRAEAFEKLIAFLKGLK